MNLIITCAAVVVIAVSAAVVVTVLENIIDKKCEWPRWKHNWFVNSSGSGKYRICLHCCRCQKYQFRSNKVHGWFDVIIEPKSFRSTNIASESCGR